MAFEEQNEIGDEFLADDLKPEASLEAEEIEIPKEAEKEAETEENAPPSYQPNFSYRVKDENREIPERFRSLITDEQSEKEVREIFEKADGLAHTKQRRDQLQEEIEAYRPIVQTTQEALAAIKRGDLTGFFEKVGLSNKDIFEYTHRQLELRKNPELYQASETQRMQQAQNLELQQNYANLQNQFQDMAVQQRQRELDFTLERPDIRASAEAFDQRLGAGAFRAECIRVAKVHALQNQDISAEDAARYVQRLSGWQPPQTPAAPSKPSQAQRQSPPKTLPNISGSSTSPARRSPQNLADLKQLAKEMEASGN